MKRMLFSAILALLTLGCVACGDNAMMPDTIGIHDRIEYTRHEFHAEPEAVTGTLLSFVYDIPYFGACGVFPPLPVVNQVFENGGGDGGMSPGASWHPFRIDEATYDALLAQVRETNPITLKDRSRYHAIKFVEDPDFDSITDLIEWSQAVCDKHRERFHALLANTPDT
ncbi:MAG TPA: hypothetical protein ENJ21_04445 [Chromatiaceae bacterium]|nr:hypothetical protein [Chromatiaceae bacterium]